MKNDDDELRRGIPSVSLPSGAGILVGSSLILFFSLTLVVSRQLSRASKQGTCPLGAGIYGHINRVRGGRLCKDGESGRAVTADPGGRVPFSFCFICELGYPAWWLGVGRRSKKKRYDVVIHKSQTAVKSIEGAA